MIYIQKQFAPYILYIIQQNFANALRLHCLRNKNAFNIFAIQPDKSLYLLIVLIDIDSCLQQQFFHKLQISFPILSRNKIMSLYIGIQPYISNSRNI